MNAAQAILQPQPGTGQLLWRWEHDEDDPRFAMLLYGDALIGEIMPERNSDRFRWVCWLGREASGTERCCQAARGRLWLELAWRPASDLETFG